MKPETPSGPQATPVNPRWKLYDAAIQDGRIATAQADEVPLWWASLAPLTIKERNAVRSALSLELTEAKSIEVDDA